MAPNEMKRAATQWVKPGLIVPAFGDGLQLHAGCLPALGIERDTDRQLHTRWCNQPHGRRDFIPVGVCDSELNTVGGEPRG